MEPEPALVECDITKIFTTSFRVKGRVRGLKLDGGLSKTVKFSICTKKIKSIVKEISIDPYECLPIYSPLLLYDVELKMDSSGSIFYAQKIHSCSRLFGKNGIPKKYLLGCLPQDKRKTVKRVPDVLTRMEEINGIKGEKATIATLRALCAPYFRGPVFFDMIRYFPYSLLKTMTDRELKKLKKIACAKPYLFCFRESLSIAVDRCKRPLVPNPDIRPELVSQLSVLSQHARPEYSLSKWTHLVSDAQRLKFDGSCPLWNVAVLKNFSADHQIQASAEQLKFFRQCIFFYIACERVRMSDYSTAIIYSDLSIELTEEMKGFFAANNLLISPLLKETVSTPFDNISELELLSLLSKRCENLEILDSDYILEDMCEYLLMRYTGVGANNITIVVPSVSCVLYLIGKMERGPNFKREKPKRGRKRKVQEVNQAKVDPEPINQYSIFSMEQWLEISRSLREPPSELVIFNAQEYTTSQLVEMLRFLKGTENKIKKLQLVGNSNMWCIGVPPTFNCLAMHLKVGKIEYDKKKKKNFEIGHLFANTGLVKKCDIYENNELFSESLVEWFKNNDVKWCSKIVLFTNESLMNKISDITNGLLLKLGTNRAIYVDSLIKVERIGLFGVLKKAMLYAPNRVLKPLTDPNKPIFPELHRYILKVEDYYTKRVFTIDTKFYRCITPTFALVKDCLAIPYEFVILITDKTTTIQDIHRAAELSKGTFMIYYRKGVEIDEVLKVESKFPTLGLEEKLKHFAKMFK